MIKATKEVTIRVVLHILVWAIILALPLYSVKRLQFSSDFLLIYYSYTIINGLLFYANYLLLIPKLFFRKRRISYYLSALALVVCFYFVSDVSNNIVIGYLEKKNPEGLERRLPGPPRGMRLAFPIAGPHIVGYVSSSLFIVFLSLGVKVLERQSKVEKMQEEMEKEKLNAELAFLKNQISPHFFFNTLNNIYSLIGINAEDSQKAVLKLSKLMRYLLYESEHGDTKLSYEIDFMKNYIDLMKLRMSDKIDLTVSFPKKYEDKNIPPLLFIPFIENAFKHGISHREKSFIDINMMVSKELITFRCLNSLIKTNEDTSSVVNSGIGLDNAGKRLNLLFPGRHELRIDKGANTFEVFLTIKSE